jgi:hypothetical protein
LVHISLCELISACILSSSTFIASGTVQFNKSTTHWKSSVQYSTLGLPKHRGVTLQSNRKDFSILIANMQSHCFQQNKKPGLPNHSTSYFTPIKQFSLIAESYSILWPLVL